MFIINILHTAKKTFTSSELQSENVQNSKHTQKEQIQYRTILI